MSLLRRLFSAEYRAAMAAEAAGDYLSAARSYGLCGEKTKVARMHLAQAGLEQNLGRRIHALTTAVSFAPPDGDLRPQALKQLAEVMAERAHGSDLSTAAGRRDMAEAAARFEEGGWDEQAGDCWLELDNRDRSAAAYSRAGLVEKVEQVLSVQEETQDRRRREESWFKDYEMLLQGGQRSEALTALRRCIEVAQRKGEYRRLLGELEQRLLERGQVHLDIGGHRLLLCGTFPLLMGRDPQCQVQVRGSSVSRRHCRVLCCPPGGFTLEDDGSHNGTLLSGLRIGAPMPLPASGTIGLGDDCLLEYVLVGQPHTALDIVVRSGLDADRRFVAGTGELDLTMLLDQGPALGVWFDGGHPMARPRGGLLQLNGARTATSVQLIQDDVLELDGRPVKVLG